MKDPNQKLPRSLCAPNTASIRPTQDETQEALAPLRGLPLSHVSRAAGMPMFCFGKTTPQPGRKGVIREVHDYAIHIQCPWRFRDPSRILVGNCDIYHPADLPWGEPVPEDFRWDRSGANRCDSLFDSFMASHAAEPLLVSAVIADPWGGFMLEFDKGFALEVFPDFGMPDEVWRLLPPHPGAHFVMEG